MAKTKVKIMGEKVIPTKLQKEIIEVLIIQWGYKNKYPKFQDHLTFEKPGYMDVDVEKINSIADLMKCMHNCGHQEKAWEIKRVLEIV